MNLNFMLEWEE